MKTWTWAALAASLVSVVSASPLAPRQQRQFTAITGPTRGGIVERKPFAVLQRDSDAFNLYMLALIAMQKMPESDSLSYYQLSGIHGRPHIPWQEPASPENDPEYGYCTHNSALFATWHRPYVSLVEQLLVAHAVTEASKFSGNDSVRWSQAANRIRLPYWDWASEDTQSAIPAIMMQPQVQVTQAGANGAARRVTVANPLYQYNFTNQAYRTQYFVGFQQLAPSTLRQPLDTVTSQDSIADANMRNTYAARRQNTYNLFSIPTFREFSNTAFSANGTPNTWTSVESIHNQVHASIGGTTPNQNGHMSTVDYSAFDPIFWLHHCNVDRLIAMYQASNPGQVVTPQAATRVFAERRLGLNDTIDTPLWPFRKSNGQYFTSRDVSTAGSVWGLGYAYPEIPAAYSTRSSDQLRTYVIGRVNSLYSPAAIRTNTKRAEQTKRREWLCHFVFNPAEVGSVAELEIYLGRSSAGTATAVNSTGDYYVGSGSALGKSKYDESDKAMLVTATVPLTVALAEEGVDSTDVPAVVEYLASNLKWKMKKGDKGEYDLKKIPSLKVGVSSTEVTYGGPNELPKWGKFETYYEITESKKCGMTKKDSHIVDSSDAPSYLPGKGKKGPKKTTT